MSTKKKIIIVAFIIGIPFLAVILAGIILFFITMNALNSSIDTSLYTDGMKDPVQLMPQKIEYFKINHYNNTYTLTTLASYKLTAKVVSKKTYYWDWSAAVAPYDFALAWGKLVSSDSNNYIKYSQSNRWYYFRYSGDCPYSKNYIQTHSANTHMIPANDNIKKALGKINTNQIAYFEGYLVKLDGTNNGTKVWWNSSLKRTDTGDGSCELFYVNKIIYNGETFQ
ncbi:MAG: hypothetical protein AB1782_14795 [Cyanobacteriota bacterium]